MGLNFLKKYLEAKFIQKVTLPLKDKGFNSKAIKIKILNFRKT
jgi:hypothetical protein